MKKPLFFGLLVLCANNSFAAERGEAKPRSSDSIKHGDRVYIDSEQVYQAMEDLKRQISYLSRRVEKLERRQQQGAEYEKNIDQNPWVCTLSPTFSKQNFIAKADTKSEAEFFVIEKCLDAGIDKFYCNQKRTECTDN